MSSILLQCPTCKKEFRVDRYRKDHSITNFCCHKCYRVPKERRLRIIKNSNPRKGENHPFWRGGKPKCFHCGVIKKTYIGKYCRNCAQVGERGPRWEGGKTKLFKAIRSSKRYKKWRLKVIQNNKKECCLCYKKGKLGKILFVDHLIPLADLFKKFNIKNLKDAYKIPEIWNIENGRILCRKCHDKTESSQRLFFKKTK